MSETSHCPACGREAESMGVLDSGERIYVHGANICFHSLDDEYGLLSPAVEQILAHKEAES